MLRQPSQAGKAVALTVADSRAGNLHRELKGIKIRGYSVRSPRYRYTEWNEGEYGRELYDYESDPQEFTNLATAAEHAPTVAQMKALLGNAKAVAGAFRKRRS